MLTRESKDSLLVASPSRSVTALIFSGLTRGSRNPLSSTSGIFSSATIYRELEGYRCEYANLCKCRTSDSFHARCLSPFPFVSRMAHATTLSRKITSRMTTPPRLTVRIARKRKHWRSISQHKRYRFLNVLLKGSITGPNHTL